MKKPVVRNGDDIFVIQDSQSGLYVSSVKENSPDDWTVYVSDFDGAMRVFGRYEAEQLCQDIKAKFAPYQYVVCSSRNRKEKQEELK